MTKINHEEYELLKGLDDYWKWKWIARDSAGLDSDNLHSYSEKPHKDYGTKTWSTDDNRSFLIYEQPFQFIQWEDENPWNIRELIEEYEGESEETEVKKDIDWAKKQIGGLETETSQNYPHDEMIEREIVLGILSQLDEPEVKQLYEKIRKLETFNDELIRDNNQFRNELDNQEVLSSEWIGQKSIDTHVDTLSGDVQVTLRLDDLENLPLPEWELPVIPQFVAEFLKGKEKYMLYELLDNDFIYDNHDALARWLYDNDEDTNKEREISLVLAHIYGYEVEEEPLYRARLKVITNEFIASYLRTQSSAPEDRLKTLEIGSKYIHEEYRYLSEFTEDELKKLDIWASNQWEIEEVEEWC